MKKWQGLDRGSCQQNETPEEILKILLRNRFLKTKKEINDFLNPPEPSRLDFRSLGIKPLQMKKAVLRIKKAIKKQESVVVYGDYDADGVCGAAILWEILHRLGAKVMPYIPHRVEEGYGLSQKGIDFLKQEYDVDLILTVDHGIGSLEKIEYCQKLGIDVIITDHHVASKKLPVALAIVHTTNLCGTGVAWMLAREIVKDKLEIEDYLDLVAIATVADMVSLTGTNRILVKYGLEKLRKTQRLGLNALIKEAQVNKEKISVYDISHVLAPRLNAMGRLTHALDALRLLCTKDEDKARSLARELEATNHDRQKLMEETILHAEDLLKKQMGISPLEAHLLYISHRSYNQGIIGLVAGRLVEKFYRPSIVIAEGEVYSKGSARSINGFNIIETIRKAEDLLIDAGGHPMAAGFTIETKHLELFKKRLTEIADQELDEEKLTRVLKFDCEINLKVLNFELFEKLTQFAPFGLGNPEPVFVSRRVLVKEAKKIGADGKHLRLLITQDSLPITLSAVAFGLGDFFAKLSREQKIDIAYTLSVDEWQGQKKLDLKIKDIKLED